MTASKLARVLAISVVLAALSLGGTAHAQESDDPPAQGGVTQPDPDPQPDPGTEPAPDPGTEPAPDPGTEPAPDPGTEPAPGTRQTPDPETQATPQTQPTTAKPDPSDGPDSWSEPVGPTRVRVSPQAGGPGTVVTMVADIQGSCDTGYAFFQDRKQAGTSKATVLRDDGSYDMKANRVVARYTVSSKDAVGWGRFAMSCDMRLDTYRVGYAKFRVLRSGASAGKNTTNRDDGSQLPNRIDTGLGGTADDDGPGGLDPTRLLLPAGLLLIIVGAGLGLRQAARSRR
jgi:hypothetical protein